MIALFGANFLYFLVRNGFLVSNEICLGCKQCSVEKEKIRKCFGYRKKIYFCSELIL